MFFRIVFVHMGRVVGVDWPAGFTVADVPKRERRGGEGGDRFHVNALLSGVLKAWFVWYYL